jgi:uncharacterized protein (TIGR00375 family)
MPTSPELVADLHIHSHYARATSRDLTLEHLAKWAQLKGVQLVGTGDIAHPGWLEELHAALEPAEEGLYRLKPEIATTVAAQVPSACQAPVRFMLVGEISNIYKRHGAVRKVHNLVFAPSLEVVASLQQALERIGNIRSDGRPILGLDSCDLLELILDVDPRCALIPAHIWTPWFSMLGSKSGFDTVEECFGDLTGEIFALETGLSSDPPMNWRVSGLDGYTLISNSDAHSPQKLAREATLLRCAPSYAAVMDALRRGTPDCFGGTLEFFPEEGKYHLDGHRKCGVCWEPPTSLAHDLRCPVCGKAVTVGVMHRVEQLADRPPGGRPAQTAPFTSLVPLNELLGEVLGVGATARRVTQESLRLLGELGPELVILRQTPLDQIATVAGEQVAEAVARLRRGEVIAQGGYDGEYGVIKLFGPQAPPVPTPQLGLFGAEATPLDPPAAPTRQPTAQPLPPAPLPAPLPMPTPAVAPTVAPGQLAWLTRLNPEQAIAATTVSRPLAIIAGPGTGKTRTLTVRLAYLLATQAVAPEAILAITFTNKAAAEMRDRLVDLVGEAITARVNLATFHALGAQILRRWGDRLGLSRDFAILDSADAAALLQRTLPDLGARATRRTLDWISHAKSRGLTPDAPELGTLAEAAEFGPRYVAYTAALTTAGAVDFDDLIRLPLHLLTEQPEVAAALHARYRWISVDEYQDVNLAQYRLLQQLAAGGANVCVIGDPDQAIYGFRGADPAYFHAIAQDFPNAVTVQLRASYRAPQGLLDAAAQVIGHNPAGVAQHEARALVAAFTQAVTLEVYPAPTDRAEAEFVVHAIEQAVGGTSYFSLDSGRVSGNEEKRYTFGDFAVLYRLGTQRRALIEAFARSGIPYQVADEPGAEGPGVRQILALLRLRSGQGAPTLPLTTLLGGGKGALDAAAIDRLAAAVADVGVAQALRAAATDKGHTPARRKRLGGLLALWADWPEAARVAAQIEPLWKAWAAWQGVAPSAAHQTQMAQLRLRATPFGDQPIALLDHLALQTAADAYDPRADRVALLTLHAAKGLEFPVVFMVGCEEGLLPYLPSMRGQIVDPTELEDDTTSSAMADRVVDIAEERRLFYVGMTRAQNALTLCHAGRRLRFGETVSLPRSRFVEEIEAARKTILTPSPLPQKRERPDDQQMRLF